MMLKFLLAFVVVALIAEEAGAQKAYQTAALKKHNEYRAKHGVPALTMDANLNTLAEKCSVYYANKGKNDHSCPYKAGAGENLVWGKGGSWSQPLYTAERGTQLWYDEVKLYDYNKPGFSAATGHFTAVVWKASTKFGFGVTTNASGTFGVGLYSPHGNVQGQFPQNVPRVKK